MRVLLLSLYFDPEPYLKGLSFAKELVRQGHEVEVLTGFPNYPGGKIYPGYRMRLVQRELMEGIPVIRVPLYMSHDSSGLKRMVTYLSFGLSAGLLGPWLVRKPDVIYVYYGHGTTVIGALGVSLLRGAPYVLDIQDLWPDTITSSGMLPPSLQSLVPLVEWWCRYTYRKAGRIVALSKGIKATLVDRGVPPEKVQVIHNWCNEVQTHSGPLNEAESRRLEGRFNIVVAGNMGKLQALKVIPQAAEILQSTEPRAQFVLVGDGVERPMLEAMVKERNLSNVAFLPRRPVGEIGALLGRADALLLHLKDDPLFAITIPSRLQAYLAVGRPILCGVRGDSMDLVQESGGGMAFQPESPESLAEAVHALCQMSVAERAQMGERGRRFYQEGLSLEVGTRAFVDLFKDLTKKS